MIWKHTQVILDWCQHLKTKIKFCTGKQTSMHIERKTYACESRLYEILNQERKDKWNTILKLNLFHHNALPISPTKIVHSIFHICEPLSQSSLWHHIFPTCIKVKYTYIPQTFDISENVSKSYQFSYHPAFSVPDFACFWALLSILARLL